MARQAICAISPLGALTLGGAAIGESAPDGCDAFVAALDAEGAVSWSRILRFSQPTWYATTPFSVVGVADTPPEGILDLGDGPQPPVESSMQIHFVTTFGPTGEHRWKRALDGWIDAAAIDPADGRLVVGEDVADAEGEEVTALLRLEASGAAAAPVQGQAQAPRRSSRSTPAETRSSAGRARSSRRRRSRSPSRARPRAACAGAVSWRRAGARTCTSHKARWGPTGGPCSWAASRDRAERGFTHDRLVDQRIMADKKP